MTEPGWEFVFDVDRAAAKVVREQITAELLDSQDPAAGAHFPDPQFGRLVRGGQGSQAAQGSQSGQDEKAWIFL